jgi:tetratricopeptide (TPR) repeat protein
MTELQRDQTIPEDQPIAGQGNAEPEASENETDAEEAPEPWTPERVTEWNNYFDVYVMLAALLLVFAASCNYVTDAHLWLHLRTGQVIAEQSGPVTKDIYSYTQSDKPWVDLPWLFQWAHAALYEFVSGLVPVNPNDSTANRPGTEQIAIGALVTLAALVRLLTAVILLKIRHRGPGLWWSATCVALAFGVIYHPYFPFGGLLIGGISGPALVSPTAWAQALLSLELLILYRSFGQGRGGALWFLVPLFCLWANIDDSFLIGLVILAATSLGRLLDGPGAAIFVPKAASDSDSRAWNRAGRGEQDSRNPAKTSSEEHDLVQDQAHSRKPPSAAAALLVLALAAAAVLINPFTYRAYTVALEPYLGLFGPAASITTADRLSFFGPGIRNQYGPDYWYFPAYYLAVVAAVVGSFLLNARRFSWRRFLPFAAMAVIWGIFMRTNVYSGMVFAAVLALNGQEWYQDRFGTEGRLGRGWAFWSTGGRLVTLALLFFIVIKDITGWRNPQSDVHFGFGFRPDDFAFDAADFLNSHNEITGNILNTSPAQGDVLIWKTAGRRKTYIDGRSRFFDQTTREEWNKIRNAIRDDDKETWKPLLDKYHITAIMIDPSPVPGGAPITYRTLMVSPNWIPFYDDGQIVMFGRADAPASDLAVFKASRLDPELQAFHTNRPIPGAERPPNPTSWMDDYFQDRTLSRPQFRTDSALRWLEGLGPVSGSPATEPLPEPARCLLAIQEARIALSRSPDDWMAFRRLKDAYAYLMQQEGALLAGIALTPENQDRIRSINFPIDQLMLRYRQRVTALNAAIETTPPPWNAPARRQLRDLNLELYQLYLRGSARDLARDHLQKALELNQDGDIPAEAVAQLQQVLAQLNEQSKKLEDQLADRAIERQANPIDQANFALAQGAPGWAIQTLADANLSSMSPALVKPQLVDLYCHTGQPDKALELLAVGAIDDPNLGSQPGMSALRQGMVYFLLGNYSSAATLWQDRSIPRVRFDRSNRVLAAGAALVRGEAMQATNTFLALPGTLSTQAAWEYDLALCKLEGGLPEEAGEHFTRALTMAPDLAVRPVAAYYLEKLGKPVPPPKRPAPPTPDKSKGAKAKAKTP